MSDTEAVGPPGPPAADPDPPAVDPAPPAQRYTTPTGDPCPRRVHVDGRVEGDGECLWCGFCLLVAGLP